MRFSNLWNIRKSAFKSNKFNASGVLRRARAGEPSQLNSYPRISRNRDDPSILGGERPTGAGTEPNKVSSRREFEGSAKEKNRIDTEILR